MEAGILNDYTFMVNGPQAEGLPFFIDRYLHFYCEAGSSLRKNLWPCTYISIIFSFTKTKINASHCADVVIIGLHEDVYLMQPLQREIDTISVHFSAAGFARFSNVAASSLTGTLINAADIFGESVRLLFNKMKICSVVEERGRLLDNFFIEKIKPAGYLDLDIAALAEALQCNPEVLLSDICSDNVKSLSYRHISRLFKSAVGVNMQTFRRIARFETAKELIVKQMDESLTKIGYESGYYDQAHFAREFKKMSGRNAKDFGPLCPE